MLDLLTQKRCVSLLFILFEVEGTVDDVDQNTVTIAELSESGCATSQLGLLVVAMVILLQGIC